VLVFPVVTWLFGGRYGLAVGLVIALVWALLRIRTSALWGAAVAAMAAAPVALLWQGLPKTPVAGPGFAASHLAAHALVGVSLSLAAFAAIIELLGVETQLVGRPSLAHRVRGAMAVLREKAQPPAGSPFPGTDAPEDPPPSSGSPWPPPG
jgi:hypothetical protein